MEVGGPHTVTVTWSPPTQPNGNITAYTLSITPSGRVWIADGEDRTFTITDLDAYTNYTVYLTANTSAGEGEATSHDVRTAEDGESHDQSQLAVSGDICCRVTKL